MTDIAVYMVTHENVDETVRVIDLLTKNSDCNFDLFVADSGSGPVMQKRLQALETGGDIKWLTLFPDNVGQNIGSNACLDEIYERNQYEWIVRWSPDVEPKGRRALKKLVRAARMFKLAGVNVLVHPKVQRGEKPKPLTLTGDDIGFPYYEAEIAKGFVRVAHKTFYKDWRYNSYGALAYGESAETKERAISLGAAEVVVENVRVKHLGDEPGLIERHVGYGL